MIAEEFQLVSLVCHEGLLQGQSAKQAGKHADGEEEAGPARHSALAIERNAAARHDHVKLREMGHGRAPAVSRSQWQRPLRLLTALATIVVARLSSHGRFTKLHPVDAWLVTHPQAVAACLRKIGRGV